MIDPLICECCQRNVWWLGHMPEFLDMWACVDCCHESFGNESTNPNITKDAVWKTHGEFGGAADLSKPIGQSMFASTRIPKVERPMGKDWKEHGFPVMVTEIVSSVIEPRQFWWSVAHEWPPNDLVETLNRGS